MARRGIAPPVANEMDLFEVNAVLGQHRHPDWWTAGDPDPDEKKTGHKAAGGRQVRSPRDSRSMLDQSKSTFAARRAAAAGQGPKPEARATGASPVIARLQG